MIWLSDMVVVNLLGRLHPLVVHFPIGLLVGALILETLGYFWKRGRDYSGMVYLGALSAIFAAIFGMILRTTGDYEGSLLDQHQIMGFLTAGIALIAAALYWMREDVPKNLPYLSLWCCCIALTIASHLGGTITHGEGYFSDAWRIEEAGPENHEVQALLAMNKEADFPVDRLDDLNIQVRAIFAHRCYQCHSTAKRKGGLALDHKVGVFMGGDSGEVIVKGDADNSELIRRLQLPKSSKEAMPPRGKRLTEDEINLIALWIDKGAPWADKKVKIFREAPMPLRVPDVPQTPLELTNPIDRLVHAYFQEHNIPWPEAIDDRQFIRRSYLDVVGLLPNPDSIAVFMADSNPDKRSQLVERLVKQKEAYATHWLSFWNDLLRNDYSGTGYITGGRKQITEWIYQSLLRAKPYDVMVRELVNPTQASEGFINGIKWRGEVNASQRTELQAAQNIAQSLMGLNLKCASCHNSFINNLTLDQAYGFANVFAKEPLEIYRCDKPTGVMAKTAFIYPELGEIVGDSLKDRLKSLAGVMVQPANGRLYRTIVNRYWDRLLGRGIVAPVDEMDNVPWSQDLLDWLTVDFVEHDYDLNHLLVQIMTSQTYQFKAVGYASPDYLLSESFVFKGPTVRRLTTEQFVDAIGQTIAPIYSSVAYDPTNRQVPAKWIWHEEIEVDRRVLPKPEKRLLRKTFPLSKGSGLKAARLIASGDDTFILSVNGTKVAESREATQVTKLDLPLDLFRDQNVLGVEGQNLGNINNPAGFILWLKLDYMDGSTEEVVSDRSWKSTADTTLSNWHNPDYDDQFWQKAWQAGSFEKSYWGRITDFRFEQDTMPTIDARASLVMQDDFMKTLGRPVRENVVTKRDDENTLLQSLMLTNGSQFHKSIAIGAKSWLRQYGDQYDTLVNQLFLDLLGRKPSNKEQQWLIKQLKQSEEPQLVLEDVIWSLLLLPEFQLI